jgi:hypothetical protein
MLRRADGEARAKRFVKPAHEGLIVRRGAGLNGRAARA